MLKPKSTSILVRNTILTSVALFISVIIFIIDINVPIGLGVGGIYSMVILYSWILPGRLASLYIGFLCTIMIITAMWVNSDALSNGNIAGVNSFISIIVVWVCVTLVTATKSGYVGLQNAMESLEDKVAERTRDLFESQKQLEVSEKIYRYLYEHANEMHASVHLDDNLIERCNDTLCGMLGYTKAEILKQPIQMLHHDSCKEAFAEYLVRLKEEGELQNAELQLSTKSGAKIEVILNVSSVINDKGEILKSRFSYTNVTELKRIENERIAYAKRLEVKNKELEQFVFIASHDLQEPLRTVTSFSELLSEEYFEKFDETGKDSLNFILEATGRMQNLVKGLLDYSRIGKGTEIQELNFSELLLNLKKDLSLKIGETNTIIEYVNLPSTISGHKNEVTQLFLNLIVNSIKFTKPNVSPRVKISAIQSDDEITFCVEDNGICISVEHQKKIFEIFKRLNNRNLYDGTGIGLAHCQKIVDLHGGKIWVESELEIGSKFFFTLKTNAI